MPNISVEHSLHTESSFGQFSSEMFCLIARSKRVGSGWASERKSLQRSLNNLRSAPCSAWLICQIIKVEWTKQKKAGNDPLGPCSFNREAVKTQFSCPLRMVHISYQTIKQPRNVFNFFRNVKGDKFSKFEARYRDYFCFQRICSSVKRASLCTHYLPCWCFCTYIPP